MACTLILKAYQGARRDTETEGRLGSCSCRGQCSRNSRIFRKNEGLPFLRLSSARPRLDLVNIFHVCAQDFRHTPGLRHTAARAMRRVPFKDLGDMPEACFGKMVLKRLQPFRSLLSGGSAGSIDLYICRNKRTEKPRPHCSLMISTVTFGWSTSIVSAIL